MSKRYVVAISKKKAKQPSRAFKNLTADAVVALVTRQLQLGNTVDITEPSGKKHRFTDLESFVGEDM